VVAYDEQETGPGLVLIEGGTFSMGRNEQDITVDWNNIPRRVTVSSFYMDETEVANVHYLEYLYWISRVYGADYPEVYRRALPDTLVWRDRLAYNEPFVELYLRHPAYQQYPVVGVSWLQASDFCAWAYRPCQ
jgi:gliding motility-associated lipoprotein GldJ